MAKLKVFRTAIGFHDAYVAVPTKKAALAAWGANKNLFQRGDAEEVTDPALTRAPLARPGEVIKVVRGTEAEHLAALPPDAPQPRKKAEAEAPAKPDKAKNARKAKPRPSRAELDAAEDALDDARTGFEKRLGELARREAELARDRRALDAERRDVLERLERARDTAHDRYETALAKWREQEG